MILIVAPEDDLHAQVVSEHIQRIGHSFHIWNTTWFPWRDRISWTMDDVQVSVGTTVLELSDVRRIWWRRFRGPTPSPLIEDRHVKNFCASEAMEVIRGIFDAGLPITNDPRSERRADSKLLQLRSAKSVGLAVPRTLVSNDPVVLREFVANMPQAIVKPLVCDYPHSIDTRPCSLDDFADDAATPLAPTLVQELIRAVADIRVCIIGNRLFAAELRRPDINQKVDWRMTTTGWKQHRLPTQLEDRLLAFTRCLSLQTGSIDMRLAVDGEYIFLEVNPSGQFLFLEIDAGLPVSRAFAELLVNNCSG